MTARPTRIAFCPSWRRSFNCWPRKRTWDRLREELMPGLRSFPYARYVVFFMPERDGIEIVRVVHSARDIVADDFGSQGLA